MKEAGQAFVVELDKLGLGVQAAAWLYFHGIDDWKFFVATPLVETMGRKRVYSHLADALDVIGAPGDMTVFDLHLENPDGPLFQMLRGLGHFDRALVCSINGVKVDGLFYRLDQSAAPRMKYPKKAAAQFVRNVEKILERAA